MSCRTADVTFGFVVVFCK